MAPLGLSITIGLLVAAAYASLIAWCKKGDEDKQLRDDLTAMGVILAGAGFMFLQYAYFPQLPDYTVPAGVGALAFIWVAVVLILHYPTHRRVMKQLKLEYQMKMAELEAKRSR